MVGKRRPAESIDDRGLMAIVCCHEIANIDCPGEQQIYVVVLTEHLYSFLPEITTVILLYDVGYVL
jgi:hypothetical protein